MRHLSADRLSTQQIRQEWLKRHSSLRNFVLRFSLYSVCASQLQRHVSLRVNRNVLQVPRAEILP